MKKRLFLILISCVVVLTGCGMGVELDPKENELIAEYAAGVMLMHSHYYDDRYDKPWMYTIESDTEDSTVEEPTTEEPTTEEPTTEESTTPSGGGDETEKPSGSGDETETPSGNGDGTEKPSGSGDGAEKPSGNGNGNGGEAPTTEEPVELDLTDVFGTHPVEVNYVDYTVCDSYDVDPDGFFEIIPDKDCSFLVLNFTLNNRSFVNQTVSTIDKDIIIRLTINEENKYNNYDASMLMNDLTVLNETALESKELYDVVIVYMIPTELANNIESMFIEVASDMENEGILILK